jgi:hypothetical protein
VDAFNGSYDGSFTLCLDDPSPLPIELVFFSATPIENQRVILEWQTSSEINNAFFTIERSKNGFDWEIVKKIDGAGNSTTLLNYSVFDNNPHKGVSYYRLKQTDFDGQFKYSELKSVNLNLTTKTSIDIFPNPTNKLFTINGSKSELSEIRIFNIHGQDVSNLTTMITTNESTITVDLSQVTDGLYYVITRTTANKVYKQ